jgi:hypothetical protein
MRFCREILTRTFAAAQVRLGGPPLCFASQTLNAQRAEFPLFFVLSVGAGTGFLGGGAYWWRFFDVGVEWISWAAA